MASQPGLDPQVFYCRKATSAEQSHAGFGVQFDWDTPLLAGYRHTFLRNVAKHPTIATFGGLDTPDIREIIVPGRYDAVIVLGWQHKSFWQAIRACWSSGTPVMVRSDSHLHTERPRWKTALKWLPYRWAIPKFDACLAVGTWSREYFRHFGAAEERVFCVPHVIDQQRFLQAAEDLRPHRAALRHRWGLRDEAMVFLFAGKLVERKRPMDFVRAVQLAVSSGASVMGLVVGDGPLRHECEEYVRAHRVPIHFAGFLNQSQVVESYVAGDALVVPSDGQETWGLVVNEAMTCGRPAILSDRVGCGPDLVIPGETGSIFPLGNIESLAATMAYSGTNPELAETMGSQAARRAAEYTPQAAVNGVLQALARVKGGRD
jgi:glycosyltransferase involved in cell wall biosynthesis